MELFEALISTYLHMACGRIINRPQMMSWSRSATTPQLTECITLPLPRAAETVSVYNTLFNVGCRYIYIETSILSPDLGQCRSAHLVLV